jgi:hypothetical protein
MRNGLFITGAAITALVAGGASATIHKSHHKSHMGSAEAYAAPSQPIPYAQLDSYLAAKPSQRAAMMDSGASMGAGPTPQTSDTGMSPPAHPSPDQTAPAGDQMGGQTGAAPNDMSGSSGAPAASGDTGASGAPPAPEATQGAPDGSSPPPK